MDTEITNPPTVVFVDCLDCAAYIAGLCPGKGYGSYDRRDKQPCHESDLDVWQSRSF